MGFNLNMCVLSCTDLAERKSTRPEIEEMTWFHASAESFIGLNFLAKHTRLRDIAY